MNFHYRVAQIKGYAEIIQTLHDIPLQSARIGHDLQDGRDVRSFQRHAARHDEPDIPRAEYNDLLSRKIAHQVDVLLRRPRGIKPGGTGPRDIQRPAAPFPAPHRQNTRLGFHAENAQFAVHGGHRLIP